jgi:hypothetical protein
MFIEEFDSDNIFELTESEQNEITSKLSDELIISNIREQMKATISESLIPNDILNVFNERYDFIVRYYADDNSLVTKCKNIRRNIYTEIFNTIKERFQFESKLNEENEDFYFCTKELYLFFVVNYRFNLIKFFTKFITDHSKELVKEYKSSEHKKDLMFKSLKKTIKNQDNIYIVYNIDNIIGDFIEVFNENGEDVISDIVNTDIYELNYNTINELFIENKYETYINNQFPQIFFKPLVDEETRHDIIAEIRNNLIMYYKDNN